MNTEENQGSCAWPEEEERKAESSLAPEQPVWGGLLKTPSFLHYFCFLLPPRCPIPEGTTPQSEAAGAVTMNTIGAESIRDEEAAPGRAAVTGRGGGGGKTATTSAPGGEAASPGSRARPSTAVCGLKVMLEVESRIRHLRCGVRSAVAEEGHGGGLRKRLAGLVAVGQGACWS